jgi:hypothetical protein
MHHTRPVEVERWTEFNKYRMEYIKGLVLGLIFQTLTFQI